MHTLVLANHKGGVGKSSLAVQFAHYLVREGRRVLVIDLDHQMNATRALSHSRNVLVSPVSSLQAMTQAAGSLPPGDFVLLPATRALAQLEKQGALRHNEFVTHFGRFLDSIREQFDVCIIDTNGNPDVRLKASLLLADQVLCPVQLNQEAMDGIADLLRDVRTIVSRLNPRLRLLGILPNMVQATPFQRANFVQLATQHAKRLIPLDAEGADFAFLPHRTVIAEAQAEGVPVWEIRKTSARDAWREIEPAFKAIEGRMKLGVPA